MPGDWTITSSSGGSRDGDTWHVTNGQVTVSVAGPSGSNKTMTATMYVLGIKVGEKSYQLN